MSAVFAIFLLTLMLITAIAATALAGIYSVTKPRIDAQAARARRYSHAALH